MSLCVTGSMDGSSARKRSGMLGNFLAVTRTRHDEDEDARSEDKFSDDERVVGAHNFRKIAKNTYG